MPQFLPGPVRVRVPATSANLGPGFDVLGLALAWYDEVTAELTDGPTTVEVTGAGAGEVDTGEGHLVVRAMRRTFAILGVDDAHPGDRDDAVAGSGRIAAGRPTGIRLRCRNSIPHGRGLGSSAAAIVSGILAARALVPEGAARLPREEVFALATAVEGHADNVAACVAGGVAAGWADDRGPRLVHFAAHPEIRPVACVPEDRLSTETARGLLPPTVPFADAAANAARASLLVPALTTRPDLLYDATEDRLHQSYRSAAMPGGHDLMTRLRASGVPAVVSGAGPTILAFGKRTEIDSVAAGTGRPWAIHPLDVDPDGACVLPAEPR